ncbi:adenylyltransferase/cytidyltransferase family protein [Alkalimonas amylolytica]|uniref:Glycerol-3-phosphate cytidylyltransferase n=1 Tax=Alkalimonas amylolytica TaxID=152573 RepID=A0A1H4B8H3_ALKAM|nr:adenylyltransferase/cytidyltransferase family protein [Alkalimonas amylolytica]SEA44525.1 Glycerol-3-phosphate cytidylyltransferase [Alkalimonas amylolytica]
MKTVLTYGTFDLFHIGHVNLLRRAKALGDRLIVGVSTDEFNARKGKSTLVPFTHRSEIVRSCRFVDLVIPECDWKQKADDIQTYQANVFVMGDDWQGKFDDLGALCEVVYLERTKEVSSSSLKQAISVFMQLKNELSV